MSRRSLRIRSTTVARIAAGTALALGLVACAAEPATAPAAETTVLASPALMKGKGQGQCLPDSKLIGLTSLSTADEPGTWWHLTREGLDAAGITDYLGFIEQVFGRDFADLDEAIAFVVDRTAVADANGNGLVCAYDSRGTRANLGLPNVTLYTFTVLDDRLAD